MAGCTDGPLRAFICTNSGISLRISTQLCRLLWATAQTHHSQMTAQGRAQYSDEGAHLTYPVMTWDNFYLSHMVTDTF